MAKKSSEERVQAKVKYESSIIGVGKWWQLSMAQSPVHLERSHLHEECIPPPHWFPIFTKLPFIAENIFICMWLILPKRVHVLKEAQVVTYTLFPSLIQCWHRWCPGNLQVDWKYPPFPWSIPSGLPIQEGTKYIYNNIHCFINTLFNISQEEYPGRRQIIC